MEKNSIVMENTTQEKNTLNLTIRLIESAIEYFDGKINRWHPMVELDDYTKLADTMLKIIRLEDEDLKKIYMGKIFLIIDCISYVNANEAGASVCESKVSKVVDALVYLNNDAAIEVAEILVNYMIGTNTLKQRLLEEIANAKKIKLKTLAINYEMNMFISEVADGHIMYLTEHFSDLAKLLEAIFGLEKGSQKDSYMKTVTESMSVICYNNYNEMTRGQYEPLVEECVEKLLKKGTVIDVKVALTIINYLTYTDDLKNELLKKTFNEILKNTEIVMSPQIPETRFDFAIEATYGKEKNDFADISYEHENGLSTAAVIAKTRQQCDNYMKFIDEHIIFGKVLLSHVDLDVLISIMQLSGICLKRNIISAVNEYDLCGNLKTHKDDTEAVGFVNYVRMLLEKARIFPRKPENVTQPIVEISEKCFLALIDKTGVIREEGNLHFAKKEENRIKSIVFDDGRIIGYKSKEGFFGNNYNSTKGNEAKATVSLNMLNNSVNISFNPQLEDVNAVEIVTALWGALAGGHAHSAGCPRGNYTLEEGEKMHEEALEACKKYLDKK